MILVAMLLFLVLAFLMFGGAGVVYSLGGFAVLAVLGIIGALCIAALNE